MASAERIAAIEPAESARWRLLGSNLQRWVCEKTLNLQESADSEAAHREL